MVSRTDVVAAARRIAGHVHRTPVLTSRTIDALLGAEIHFKCENLQRSGAFKILYNVRTRVYLASEEGIRDWTGRLAEIMKIVIEPSAAVTLAAMAENRSAAKGTVGVILSGGNAPLEGF